MADTAWTPVILDAKLTPNPAITGDPLLIQVLAIDVFGAEQTEVRQTGEFYSGVV